MKAKTLLLSILAFIAHSGYAVQCPSGSVVLENVWEEMPKHMNDGSVPISFSKDGDLYTIGRIDEEGGGAVKGMPELKSIFENVEKQSMKQIEDMELDRSNDYFDVFADIVKHKDSDDCFYNVSSVVSNPQAQNPGEVTKKTHLFSVKVSAKKEDVSEPKSGAIEPQKIDERIQAEMQHLLPKVPAHKGRGLISPMMGALAKGYVGTFGALKGKGAKARPVEQEKEQFTEGQKEDVQVPQQPVGSPPAKELEQFTDQQKKDLLFSQRLIEGYLKEDAVKGRGYNDIFYGVRDAIRSALRSVREKIAERPDVLKKFIDLETQFANNLSKASVTKYEDGTPVSMFFPIKYIVEAKRDLVKALRGIGEGDIADTLEKAGPTQDVLDAFFRDRLNHELHIERKNAGLEGVGVAPMIPSFVDLENKIEARGKEILNESKKEKINQAGIDDAFEREVGTREKALKVKEEALEERQEAAIKNKENFPFKLTKKEEREKIDAEDKALAEQSEELKKEREKLEMSKRTIQEIKDQLRNEYDEAQMKAQEEFALKWDEESEKQEAYKENAEKEANRKVQPIVDEKRKANEQKIEDIAKRERDERGITELARQAEIARQKEVEEHRAEEEVRKLAQAREDEAARQKELEERNLAEQQKSAVAEKEAENKAEEERKREKENRLANMPKVDAKVSDKPISAAEELKQIGGKSLKDRMKMFQKGGVRSDIAENAPPKPKFVDTGRVAPAHNNKNDVEEKREIDKPIVQPVVQSKVAQQPVVVESKPAVTELATEKYAWDDESTGGTEDQKKEARTIIEAKIAVEITRNNKDALERIRKGAKEFSDHWRAAKVAWKYPTIIKNLQNLK